ncbi:MAG: hypothetical protein Q4D16_22365 [Eubacteriales bacterium]|nr:hypothetical protein [Eubacteriales bacterium]
MVMVLALLIPVWGIVCLLILELRTRGNQEAYVEVGIEKLKINDEIHKSILMEEDPMERSVVPLGEALLINDSSTRRELMMEIMYANPDDYVNQLQEARMNNDTEVVHYAVTALAELQKEYQLQFQKLGRRLLLNPDDRKTIDDYIDLQEKYLSSGMLEGEAKLDELRCYSDMLGRKLGYGSGNIRTYCKKIEADLFLKEYETAYEEIQAVISKWPEEEKGYLFMIQYYSAVKDRAGIERVLSLLKSNKIHLSPEGRSVVQFWK